MRRNPPLPALALCLLGMALEAPTASAQAQQAPPLMEKRPGDKDIPQDIQERADDLLRQGNSAFLKETDFSKAAALYRQSLELWDHPGTHYNLTLALMNLDKPVEAYAHIQEAVGRGEAPLGAELYKHAQFLKGVLEKHLARVVIVCEPADAVVMMGGKRLPLVNGRYEGLSAPGPASFFATREGLLPRKKEIALSPGKVNPLYIKLYREDELRVYNTRWAPWIPWTGVGVGAALAAGGGLLQVQARHRYTAFDARVKDCASDPSRVADGGCRDSTLAPLRSRAEKLNTMSTRALAAGGALFATGMVFVLLNHTESRVQDPDQYEQEHGLAVAPMLGGGTTGFQATLSF